MACDPEILKNVPLFALLDAEEIAVLATQVELKTFAARERIYKKEQPGGQAYVLLSGQVRVTTLDEGQREVIGDQPSAGEFFEFASMLEQTAHHTSAIAIDETRCVEASRAIVVHSAWYVNERVIGAYGVLGRSQGCFAVADASLPEITDRLGPGRLIYAGKV